MPFVPIVLGTVRAGNRTEDLTPFVEEALHARGFETCIVEPRFGNLRHTEWTMDPRPPEIAKFVDDMARADGFVLVFPEYNHGYPGALKNVLDHLYDEWSRKPFAFVSTGGVSGGLRAQENLLPVIRGLGGIVVPTSVAVSGIARGVDEEAVRRRLVAMVDDLAWWVDALSRARVEPAPAAGQVQANLVTKG